VRALALCDTAHKIGTADLWNTRIAAIEQNGIASITDSILERWFTPAFRGRKTTPCTAIATC
jgi:3-oxoadipate enol-lactonase